MLTGTGAPGVSSHDKTGTKCHKDLSVGGSFAVISQRYKLFFLAASGGHP